MKKAILAVSFGTSYNETREKTIDRFEKSLSDAFEDRVLYRAWTSRVIIKKLKSRDNVEIMTIPEAMEKMKADGIEDVLVQPSHFINGMENDKMILQIQAFAGDFKKVSIGTPLLTTQEDSEETIKALMAGFEDLPKDTALVLMGHGTPHYTNSIYAALDYLAKDMGYENLFVGTVEAYPSIETVLKKLEAFKPKSVVITPFMVVAGDHANNDLAGDDEDSWKSILEKHGYQVSCVLKGLGEYEGIRRIYVNHAKEALG